MSEKGLAIFRQNNLGLFSIIQSLEFYDSFENVELPLTFKHMKPRLGGDGSDMLPKVGLGSR